MQYNGNLTNNKNRKNSQNLRNIVQSSMSNKEGNNKYQNENNDFWNKNNLIKYL